MAFTSRLGKTSEEFNRKSLKPVKWGPSDAGEDEHWVLLLQLCLLSVPWMPSLVPNCSCRSSFSCLLAKSRGHLHPRTAHLPGSLAHSSLDCVHFSVFLIRNSGSGVPFGFVCPCFLNIGRELLGACCGQPH